MKYIKIELYYLGLYLMIAICNGYFFNWVINYYDISTNSDDMTDISKSQKFLLVCILAPILETLIFQYLPIYVIRKFVNNENWIIFSTALIFCLFHTYSIVYVFMTFIGGIIMGSFYLRSEKNGLSPIISTIMLHSFYNLYGFLFTDV